VNLTARYHIPIGTLRDWGQPAARNPDHRLGAYLNGDPPRDPEGGAVRALEGKPG